MTVTSLEARPTPTEAPPDVLGFHHLEWWVGNPRHAAQFWHSAFGFEVAGRRGASIELRQGEVRFVVTPASDPQADLADGVHDVALRVADPRPQVTTFGDTVHSLVADAVDPAPTDPVGLRCVDHLVLTGGAEVVDCYREVFGFEERQRLDRLGVTVLGDGDTVVQVLDQGDPAVVRVALATDDIVATVSELDRRGVRFLRVFGSYHDEAPDRLAGLGADLPWERLGELGILADRAPGGYLLQAVTEPVAGRPTAFVEVVQRHGAHGFGERNLEAIAGALDAEPLAA